MDVEKEIQSIRAEIKIMRAEIIDILGEIRKTSDLLAERSQLDEQFRKMWGSGPKGPEVLQKNVAELIEVLSANGSALDGAMREAFEELDKRMIRLVGEELDRRGLSSRSRN